MKKLATAIITVVLLLSILPVCSAFAVTDADYVTEDLKTLHYNGNDYIRANALRFNYGTSGTSDVQLSIPESIENGLDEYSLKVSSRHEAICELDFYYKDGSTYSAYYIRSDCYDSYVSITQGKSGEYYIDAGYPSGDVSLRVEQLYGEKTSISVGYFSGTEYDVCVKSDDEVFEHERGKLFKLAGEYYYVDCNELEPYPRSSYTSFSDYGSMPAYKITDEELLKALKKLEKEEIAATFSIFPAGTFNTVLCILGASFVFGLIPLAVLVPSVILMIRSKGKYKKMFAFISSITMLELIVFAILIILLIVL